MRPVVFVLHAGGLADLCAAVPALRALRRAYHDHDVVLATAGELQPLVRDNHLADYIHPTGSVETLSWHGPDPAYAVNLNGHGQTALAALHPERILAYTDDPCGQPDGPLWSADDEAVERWCRLLDWYFVPTEPTDLALTRPDKAPKHAGAVVFQPGPRSADPLWLASHATVAWSLERAGEQVVFTGTADERDDCVAIARAAGLPGRRVLAGRLDIEGMSALVGHARLVVSPADGIARLATAYQTPAVVLNGPTHWAAHRRQVELTGEMVSLGPDRVLAAARSLLSPRPSTSDPLAALEGLTGIDMSRLELAMESGAAPAR